MEYELLKQSENPSVDKECLRETSPQEEENTDKLELNQEYISERTKECVLVLVDE